MSKLIFQTSKYKQQDYIAKQLMMYADGWEYKHFTDNDIYEYFEKNPDHRFPKIKKKFDILSIGAHKADLFRYYYLYQNGGLFVDSDFAVEYNIDYLVGNSELMTVSSEIDKRAFNGFLYANKKNPIIFQCLQDLYYSDDKFLKANYDSVCEFLYLKIKENKFNIDINLHWWGHWTMDEFPHTMYDKSNNVIGKHYWKTKQIPRFID